MISPTEIQEQCLKWWKDVLLSSLNSTEYFPKEVARIGKVSAKDVLSKITAYRESIELLKNNSKESKELGYRLILEKRVFDKIGEQPIPQKIIIENIEDYLYVTRKEREYKIFKKNHSHIQAELPVLLTWALTNQLRLIDHDSWPDTLKVCKYFLEEPRPQLYLRQLPIDVHTKYILENRSIIQSLLEFLIPEHINVNETRFETRFNLKYSEPLIRVRFLDTSLSPLENTTDISLTLSEFNNFRSQCDNIFIAENIMNFLTLPYLPKTVAIWSGGGFSVSYLEKIDWLKDKQFYYWGDLDAQGFQILNQFRTYFASTIAVMMDEETLSSFKNADGQPATRQNLQYLTEAELKLYRHLQQNTLRLEQEKITQTYAEEKIKGLLREIPPAKTSA